MKTWMLFFICSMTLLASCKQPEPNRFLRSEQRIQAMGSAQSIDQKADLLYIYAHQDAVEVEDNELYAADPHAYWLYRCMASMRTYTETPEEEWAAYLALERCVDDYNRKLGRKHGSMELALKAVEELYGGWSAGTQYEMNRGSGLHRLLTEIRLMGRYQDVIRYMEADGAGAGLDSRYGKELKAWYRFMYYAQVLMRNYSFGMANYSAAPLEMNLIQQGWYEGRLKWLELERLSVLSSETEGFRMDEPYRTDEDLEEIINHFYNCMPTAGWDDIHSTWDDNDDEVMRPYREDSEDNEHPRLIAWQLKKAVKEWQSVRHEIIQSLPEEKASEYLDLTMAMQSFIYDILMELTATHN